jgi:hypothetical protein
MTTTISGTSITFNDSTSVSNGNSIIRITSVGIGANIVSSIANGVAQFKLISDNSSVINITSTANVVTIVGA